MAFVNGLSERMDELRFGDQRLSHDDSSYAGFTTTSRPSGAFYPMSQPPNDMRGGLQRRFTTDASKMPAASSFGQQYTSTNPGTVSQCRSAVSVDLIKIGCCCTRSGLA